MKPNVSRWNKKWLQVAIAVLWLSTGVAQKGNAQEASKVATGSKLSESVMAGTLAMSKDCSARNGFQSRQVDRVYYAECYDGADASLKINACLANVVAAEGGTCDATGLPTSNIGSQTIIVGDGAHSVSLILPAGTILFATGQNLVYRSFATVKGQGSEGEYKYHGVAPGSGSIIVCDAMTTTKACVMPYNESASVFAGLVGAHLADFSVQSNHVRTAQSNSAALMVGGNGTSVLRSTFERLKLQGFDIGTYMDGPGGCTCYNEFREVDSRGSSYGIKTINTSRYAYGVNANKWDGGKAWGATGLSESGASKNIWNGLDIEGAKTHGMVLAGYGSMVIAPYLEANGPDLINGAYNMIIGPLAYGGGAWTKDAASTCTTCLILGPDATPDSMSVRNSLVFGSKFQNQGKGDQSIAALQINSANRAIEANFSSWQTLVYGKFGHSPFVVGSLTAKSGVALNGKTTLIGIANPVAPKLTAHNGTGTTYTYYVVGHDANGGVTLPSAAATVSGPATLGTVTAATPKTPGVGYAVGDIVTIVGNNSDGNAQARVTSVTAAGGVTTLVLIAGGTNYSVLDDRNLRRNFTFLTTGGSGTGLTLTIDGTYIAISPTAIDGIDCWDVLSGDTGHLLPAARGVTMGCSSNNAYPVRDDFGQRLSEFTPPSRNTTGDLGIGGGAANKIACFKADSKTIGYCTDMPTAGGCTCSH